MAVRYFRHALIGSCEGQEIVNVLWYYTPVVSDTALAAAQYLADTWDAEVRSYWMAAMTNLYTLVRTETNAYNVSWVSELAAAYQKPGGYIGELGGNLMGQSPYVPINFTLDYSYGDVPPGHGPVKRSYLAFGPVMETMVNNQHQFVSALFPPGVAQDLLSSLVLTLSYGLPEQEAVPIRVGSTNLKDNGGPDPNKYRSWARAISANFREISSDRASRIP